jgi:hypothetical protein
MGAYAPSSFGLVARHFRGGLAMSGRKLGCRCCVGSLEDGGAKDEHASVLAVRYVFLERYFTHVRLG